MQNFEAEIVTRGKLIQVKGTIDGQVTHGVRFIRNYW